MAVKQRSGGLVILIVSIVAGLVAALLSVSFLRGVAGTGTVLVATREVQPFTPLTPEMFAAQQVPRAAVPADAVTQVSELSGRYARTLLLPGDSLRRAHLAVASGKAGSLAARLTETGMAGMRALAIPVDAATGVAGAIEPGDRVDIIAAVRIDRVGAPSTQFSKIIARAVPVLHRSMEEQATGQGTVVVQVSPAQAEEIAYAQIAGKIYLAITPYTADPQAQPTTGVTPDTFIQRHGGR